VRQAAAIWRGDQHGHSLGPAFPRDRLAYRSRGSNSHDDSQPRPQALHQAWPNALRPISVKATAGSLDEAEHTIILQAVEQCNWRFCGSTGAAAVLDVSRRRSNPASRNSDLYPSGSP
jgi:hypothetical protein